MSKTVKGYLRDIKRIYQETSDQVEKKYDELVKLNNEYTDVLKSRDYTPEGRQKKLAAIDVKRNALKHDLAVLREDANNAARKVRDDVERTFYGYYNASPEDVDLKLMELIRSGVLSEKELIHYGERANTTMRRIIGKELDKRGSLEAHQAGYMFQFPSGDPHLKAVDDLIGVGDYAVGGAKLGGLSSVHGIRSRYDELCDPIINGIKDVKSETLADGRQLFSVEGSATFDV